MTMTDRAGTSAPTGRASLFRSLGRGLSRAMVPVVAAAILAACSGSSTPDPTTAGLTVQATEKINPNAAGTASPVVVRIYELKATSVFDTAEFSQLFYDDQATLGGDMLDRREIEIAPGQTIERTDTLSSETRYLGFIAGYRDLSNATWRGKVSIESETDNTVLVTVDALSISAKIVESSWWNIF